MIRLRPLVESDVLEIDSFAHDQGVPDFSNAITHAVAVKGEELIAYGQVKMFAEAMFFPDHSKSKRDRVEALRLLMHEAYRGSREFKIKTLTCFIKDPDFALLIEKHFGFHRAIETGERLIRRL